MLDSEAPCAQGTHDRVDGPRSRVRIGDTAHTCISPPFLAGALAASCITQFM